MYTHCVLAAPCTQPKGTESFSICHSEPPVTGVSERIIHNIWKGKVAALVKRYEMDVEVGRYVC